MADLTGATGQGRRQYGRGTASDSVPVSTTPQPARPRGPKEIMKERNQREALKRLQQEEQNQIRTRRDAGVGGEGERIDIEKRSDRAGVGALPERSIRSNEQPARPNKPPTRTNIQPTQEQREIPVTVGTTKTQPSGNPNTTKPQPSATDPLRNSSATFPHAFERWETLSSHWEGLTSYWIKRLQGNSAELSGQPVNTQLARQVTDLSAAGANLFHAVVELQRLRASSERKFQRWFFEVRDDQEKTAERIAQLEADLAAARQGQNAQSSIPAPPSPEEIHKQAEQLAAEEIEKIKRQCALEIKEKNRELEISREEARRSWEEIGRLEQRDRDRTFSLRRGEPTVLGGVQVVPFQPEGSRQNRGQAGGLSQHPPETGATAYGAYDTTRSETDTDPFTEGGYDGQATLHGIQTPSRQPQTPPTARAGSESRSPARPRTAGQPFSSNSTYATNPQTSSTSGGFYKQSGAETTLHPTQPRVPGQDNRAYAMSEHSEDDYQIDDNERVMHDLQGNPIGQRTNPSSEISDEYDVLEQLEQSQMFTRGLPESYGQSERYTTSNGGSHQAPDYSGSGYGRQDWEGVPQHHHPSRLSNILEEDERSRTSETSRRLQH